MSLLFFALHYWSSICWQFFDVLVLPIVHFLLIFSLLIGGEIISYMVVPIFFFQSIIYWMCLLYVSGLFDMCHALQSLFRSKIITLTQKRDRYISTYFFILCALYRFFTLFSHAKFILLFLFKRLCDVIPKYNL